MPFCTQCGHAARSQDLYCQNCGARQPVSGSGSHTWSAGPTATASDPLAGISPRAASILCYIPTIGHVLEAVILGVSVFMMVKAAHDQPYVLPIIGELAQRSARE